MKLKAKPPSERVIGSAETLLAPQGSRESRAHGQSARVEVREDGTKHIVGHSAVFNSLSVDLGWFKEEILPAAFDEAIRSFPVTALANHSEDRMFASTLDRSLQLTIDDRGLYMDALPLDTTIARDIVTELGAGFYPGQSFSFTVAKASWRTQDGEDVRTIEKMQRVFDVGPVLWPAYPDTDVGMRQLYSNVFNSGGIDFEGLSSAFVRKFRKLELTKADRDIISRAVAFLSAMEGDSGQEPEAPADDQPSPEAWRMDLARRRLDLTAHT